MCLEPECASNVYLAHTTSYPIGLKQNTLDHFTLWHKALRNSCNENTLPPAHSTLEKHLYLNHVSVNCLWSTTAGCPGSGWLSWAFPTASGTGLPSLWTTLMLSTLSVLCKYSLLFSISLASSKGNSKLRYCTKGTARWASHLRLIVCLVTWQMYAEFDVCQSCVQLTMLYCLGANVKLLQIWGSALDSKFAILDISALLSRNNSSSKHACTFYAGLRLSLHSSGDAFTFVTEPYSEINLISTQGYSCQVWVQSTWTLPSTFILIEYQVGEHSDLPQARSPLLHLPLLLQKEYTHPWISWEEYLPCFHRFGQPLQLRLRGIVEALLYSLHQTWIEENEGLMLAILYMIWQHGA